MFNILFFTLCLAPAQPLGDDSSDSLLNAKLHLHGIPINCAKFYGTSPSKSPVVISGKSSANDVTSGVTVPTSWPLRKFGKKKHQYCRS